MILDFPLSLICYRVFIVAGAFSAASIAASLASCFVSRVVVVIPIIALAVSQIIPCSFRSLTVSLISIAVSRIAVVFHVLPVLTLQSYHFGVVLELILSR